MRSLTRIKQDIWFVTRTKDDSDLVSGYVYGNPEKHRFSVSPSSGMPTEMNFGLLPTYDRYIVSYDRKFTPKEGTFLYVDVTPELNQDGTLHLGEDGEPTVAPDYILDRVHDAKKGFLARYGIRKVD